MKKNVNDSEKQKKVVTKTKSVKEKNKTNIFKSIISYFKGVGKEIKRIRWTEGKELVKYSVAAVFALIFFGVYFYAIDWIALLVRSLAN